MSVRHQSPACLPNHAQPNPTPRLDGRPLPAQELFEVQRYFPERFVHHPQLDHVEGGQPEADAEQRQPDVLVRDRPAAHAEIPEQQFRVLVVAVQVGLAAFHFLATVAEQRRRNANQRVPQEAGGHQRLHGRFDDQPVAHAVHGQREHRRQHGRGQHGTGLRIIIKRNQRLLGCFDDNNNNNIVQTKQTVPFVTSRAHIC